MRCLCGPPWPRWGGHTLDLQAGLLAHTHNQRSAGFSGASSSGFDIHHLDDAGIHAHALAGLRQHRCDTWPVSGLRTTVSSSRFARHIGSNQRRPVGGLRGVRLACEVASAVAEMKPWSTSARLGELALADVHLPWRHRLLLGSQALRASVLSRAISCRRARCRPAQGQALQCLPLGP